MSSPFLQLFPLRGPDSVDKLSKQELLSMWSFTDIRGCPSGGQATCLSMQDKNILPSSIFHLLKYEGLSVYILLKTMRKKCFSKYRGAQMVLKTNFFIPWDVAHATFPSPTKATSVSHVLWSASCHQLVCSGLYNGPDGHEDICLSGLAAAFPSTLLLRILKIFNDHCCFLIK